MIKSEGLVATQDGSMPSFAAYPDGFDIPRRDAAMPAWFATCAKIVALWDSHLK